MQQPHQLATWDHEKDCWSRGEDIFGHSDVYSETWPTSGMTRNGVAYELPTWEPPTDDFVFSYSQPDETLLQTPLASEGTKPSNTMGVQRRLSTGQVFLTNQVVTLCGLDPSEAMTGAHADQTDASPRLLPTPAAMNPNDGESVETWEARRQRVKAEKKNGNGFGTPLAIAVQLLPTGAPTPPLSVDGRPCEEPPLPLSN